MKIATAEMAFERGVERGEARGRESLRVVALELIRGKLGDLPPPLEARVRELHDGARLTELVIALGQAHDRGTTLDVLARFVG
jgi:hypothetical protein